MSTVFFNLRIDEELNEELIKIAENRANIKRICPEISER